jgi:hypothetical protein
MDTTTNSGTHEEKTYSHMVGVFRERTNAEHARNELKLLLGCASSYKSWPRGENRKL